MLHAKPIVSEESRSLSLISQHPSTRCVWRSYLLPCRYTYLYCSVEDDLQTTIGLGTNNYWFGGQTTISLHTKPLLVCPWMTIGLGANDYWFIGQRTIVSPCLPWLPPFPRAECFSVLYLIARVIGLRDRPLPAAGEGAPHRRRA